MATTTHYFMTQNGSDTNYPSITSTDSSTSGATGRYTDAGFLATGEKVRFPTGNDAFNTPFVKFTFLDAYAEIINSAPTVSVRMPSVFNISNFSDYSKTDQIVTAGQRDPLFTSGKTGLAALASSTEEILTSMPEAINYSLSKGYAGALGFVESAGLGGIQQYEYSNKRAINPMSQILYKGPQYRKYQIPIPMKPRNKSDSDAAQKIIKAFRVASAPSYASSNDLASSAAAALGSDTAFTFGYPHLIAFDILFYNTVGSETAVQTLYKSKPCVIEAAAVDYGGQKLAFFEDGVPTEMNLTLQLTEITARTLGDELRRRTTGDGANKNFTIF
jgi:hypothetical protein